MMTMMTSSRRFKKCRILTVWTPLALCDNRERETTAHRQPSAAKTMAPLALARARRRRMWGLRTNHRRLRHLLEQPPMRHLLEAWQHVHQLRCRRQRQHQRPPKPGTSRERHSQSLHALPQRLALPSARLPSFIASAQNRHQVRPRPSLTRRRRTRWRWRKT